MIYAKTNQVAVNTVKTSATRWRSVARVLDVGSDARVPATQNVLTAASVRVGMGFKKVR